MDQELRWQIRKEYFKELAEGACPNCGERDQDHLLWQDDATLRCESCGLLYDPDAGWRGKESRDDTPTTR